MKVEHSVVEGAIRGGDRIENMHSDIHCPGVNSCRKVNAPNGQVFLCCCQDKDFCNTAKKNGIKFWILLFLTAVIYIFIHMN